MAFEDILKQIGEEADRTQVADLAKKYPSLREFAETGEKARTLVSNLGKRAKVNGKQVENLDELGTYTQQWMDWRDSHWDADRNLPKGTVEALDQLTATQARVLELEAKGNTEMTADEINALMDKRLTEGGYVKRDAIPWDRLQDKDGKPIGATTEDVYRGINSLGKRFEDITAELLPAAVEHRATFNESLDVKKVWASMDEMFKETGRVASADAAYKRAYAPKFQERDQQQRQQELAKAKEDGLNEGRRMAQQSMDGRGIPVDGKGSPSMGPLQRRIMERSKPKEGEIVKAPLGRGIIAAHEIEERRAGAGSAAQ